MNNPFKEISNTQTALYKMTEEFITILYCFENRNIDPWLVINIIKNSKRIHENTVYLENGVRFTIYTNGQISINSPMLMFEYNNQMAEFIARVYNTNVISRKCVCYKTNIENLNGTNISHIPQFSYYKKIMKFHMIKTKM